MTQVATDEGTIWYRMRNSAGTVCTDSQAEHVLVAFERPGQWKGELCDAFVTTEGSRIVSRTHDVELGCKMVASHVAAVGYRCSMLIALAEKLGTECPSDTANTDERSNERISLQP